MQLEFDDKTALETHVRQLVEDPEQVTQFELH